MPSILQLLNTTKIYGEAVLHLIHDCMQVLKMEWQLDGIIYIQLWRPEHPENYSIQLKWNPRNTILPWCYAKCCICQMLKAKQAKITHNKNEENEAEKAPSHHRWPPPPPKATKQQFHFFCSFYFLKSSQETIHFQSKIQKQYFTESLTILNAPAQRLCTKACKHHIVNCTNPCTSQHGCYGDGSHGKVNGNTVTLGNTTVPQQVGNLTHGIRQLPEKTDTARFPGNLSFVLHLDCLKLIFKQWLIRF